MKKEQAIDVLETIQEFYPTVKIGKRKAKVMLPELMKMDYEGVMHNLSAHVNMNLYPPILAEIAAYESEVNDYVDEAIVWEQEAKEVPEEIKQQFLQELDKLVVKLHADRKL